MHKLNLKHILTLALVIFIGVVGIVFVNYRSNSLSNRQNYEEYTYEEPEESINLGTNLYRRKISFNLNNKDTLKNFQIALDIDTFSLIREGKLSLDCGNIRFIDSDGKTEIPYWMEGECGSPYAKTRFWLRIPEIPANSEKSIYFYYGNENKRSTSNFDEVFKTNNNLIAWYFFNESFEPYKYYGNNIFIFWELENRTPVTDLSLNKNKGYIVNIGTFSDSYNYYIRPEAVGPQCEEDVYYSRGNDNRCYLYLNNWGSEAGWTDIKDSYFEIPSKGLNFNPFEGSIEMWVKPDNVKSGKYQRLLVDTNFEIELGIDPDGNLYFYPSRASKYNYNMVFNPFKNKKWNHIIVTWNLANKEVKFYINGEKKKNDIENVPIYWSKTAKIGNLQIGGTNLNIESVFVGSIDGIRIYNKALSEEEIKLAYRYNNVTYRYPIISFGKEEIVYKSKTIDDTYILSSIEKISVTNKIKIDNTCYAAPLFKDDFYKYPADGVYLHPLINEKIFLISKYGDFFEKPIFGLPNHYFYHAGTGVEFEDSFLLLYVGLEINNPKLIRYLRIEFRDYTVYPWTKLDNYFVKLTPIAYACGPRYDYGKITESGLSFIGQIGKIYWYKLKEPIYVNKNAQLMQIYYEPAGEEGLFYLKLVDMVFVDKNRKLVRPSFSPYVYKENVDGGEGREFCPYIYDRYLAYFANEEKGSINFEQGFRPQTFNTIFIVFRNKGRDPITIDEQSIRYIQNQSLKWVVKDIRIIDSKGNVISKISMDEIKNKILGKKLNTSFSIEIPLISIDNLDRNSYYYIVIGVGEESKLEKPIDQNKIIHWVWGDDYYYYPKYRVGDNLYLYRLYVDDKGFVKFEKAEKK